MPEQQQTDRSALGLGGLRDVTGPVAIPVGGLEAEGVSSEMILKATPGQGFWRKRPTFTPPHTPPILGISEGTAGISRNELGNPGRFASFEGGHIWLLLSLEGPTIRWRCSVNSPGPSNPFKPW